MSLTISTKGPSATNARDQAAEAAAAVLNAVDSAPQMSADDVTTTSMQLQPVYTTDREGNRVSQGYSFTQYMQVTCASNPASGRPCCMQHLVHARAMESESRSEFNAIRTCHATVSYVPYDAGIGLCSTFFTCMQVKVNNLTDERLAAVIDAAVTAGGNNLTVNSIQVNTFHALQLTYRL